jgi:hypothetical protein
MDPYPRFEHRDVLTHDQPSSTCPVFGSGDRIHLSVPTITGGFKFELDGR